MGLTKVVKTYAAVGRGADVEGLVNSEGRVTKDGNSSDYNFQLASIAGEKSVQHTRAKHTILRVARRDGVGLANTPSENIGQDITTLAIADKNNLGRRATGVDIGGDFGRGIVHALGDRLRVQWTGDGGRVVDGHASRAGHQTLDKISHGGRGTLAGILVGAAGHDDVGAGLAGDLALLHVYRGSKGGAGVGRSDKSRAEGDHFRDLWKEDFDRWLIFDKEGKDQE